MHIKRIFPILSLLVMSTCIQSSQASVSVQEVVIRTVKKSDFEQIKAFGTKAFAVAYNYTSQEQIDALRKSLDSVEKEEKTDLTNPNSVALVAMQNSRIIGFFSAMLTNNSDEIYGKLLMVDPSFQHKRIGIDLVMHCLIRCFPKTKRIVCVTRKTNVNAQGLYEYFGGKKVENPECARYLYKSSNPADFIGYEFDEGAISLLYFYFYGCKGTITGEMV